MLSNLKTLLILVLLIITTSEVQAQYAIDNQGATMQNVAPNNNSNPIVAPVVSLFDIDSAKFANLELTLQNARFVYGIINAFNLRAQDFDVDSGKLGSLDIQINGCNFLDFRFSYLRITNLNTMFFNPTDFLTHKCLTFLNPVQAKVYSEISQDDLNSFINSPKVLDSLSLKANNKIAKFANMFGINASQYGFHVLKANLKLGKNNEILIDSDVQVDLGSKTATVNVKTISQLIVNSGQVILNNTRVISGEQEMPQALISILVNKINNITKLNDTSKDLSFNFNNLTIQSNKQVILSGIANINRLRFGKD